MENEKDCFQINPLQHKGTSQDMRPLSELKPDYAPVDGRTINELILFAEKYSGLLNFFDTNNKINGDWKNFLSNDITTILSSITVKNAKFPVQTFFKYANKFDTASISDLNNYLKIFFDVSFSMLDEVRSWNDRLILASPAKEMIYGEITSNLSFYMRDLILYYNTAIFNNSHNNQANQFLNTGFKGSPELEDYHYSDTKKILLHEFKQEWKLETPDEIAGHINETQKIFGDPDWDTVKRILYSLSFFKINFTKIFNSYSRIITGSRKYFQESLDNYPYHKPNNGLMLAFFRLFGNTQKSLNTFTDRHLDFYYKDVLKIKRKPAVSDSAYIVFNLAKNINSHTLDKGTKLFAGKDGLGKELIYETDKTISLIKAEISGLKSVFLDEGLKKNDEVPKYGGIYASETANSSDGNGKELNKEDPSWFPFGQRQSSLTDDKKTMTQAEVGFMIASPVLQLSEGVRVITIEINTSIHNLDTDMLVGNLDLKITGKKGWIKCPDLTISDLTNNPNVKADNAVRISTNKITMRFTLETSVDSVIPFNSEIHKAAYSTKWPVLKVLLKKESDPEIYKALSKINVESIRITVDVSGARSCILQSDTGALENKAPFMPFGPRPKVGSSFYFGSYEVFRKRINSLTIHLKWLGLPPSESFYSYYSYRFENSTDKNKNYIDIPNEDNTHSFQCLAEIKSFGEYTSYRLPITPNPVVLFNLFEKSNSQRNSNIQDLEFANVYSDSDPNLENFVQDSLELKRGFLKLKLTNPAKAFGHEVFANTYATQVILKSKTIADIYSLPNEPYTPLLEPLSYDYTAEEVIAIKSDYNTNKGQFFQIFPFGYKESDSDINFLVMPFDEKETKKEFQGAFYIGIKNINHDDQLNLYIQVSEGSEDASIDPPDLNWFYLRNNNWIPLKDYILSDTTNKMLGSGIVTITIPKDMNEENTLMPSSMKWIQIAIPENYKAFPKVYALYTNAVKAKFINNDNATDHLSVPLPAMNINKLYNDDAAVKKVLQPYESFDGKMTEQSSQYYNRVSERLRHKNRAITIWDYERLILEQFNFLYKVKCLNHTNDSFETTPGCVRIIVIPDMTSKSAGNLYQPAISNNKRKNIKNYISQLNSPFTEIEIENPKYETIKVECKVKFKKDLVFSEWVERLKSDIDKFLAPWAFENERGINFGGTIHKSQIIKFIEKLDYVDFLTEMKFYLDEKLVEVDEAKASTSRSIITTFIHHVINEV